MPGHPSTSIILLYCCLDSWMAQLPSIIVLAIVESTVLVTVYSFCLVHFRITFFTWYSLEIFGGIVFHARMIDVADIKQTLWHVYPTAELLITPYQHQVYIYIFHNILFLILLLLPMATNIQHVIIRYWHIHFWFIILLYIFFIVFLYAIDIFLYFMFHFLPNFYFYIFFQLRNYWI